MLLEIDNEISLNLPHIKQSDSMMTICRWMGGKSKYADRIMPHLSDNTTYVEPFMGMASVFMRKSPSPVEVLNDYDGDITNLFRVLRGADYKELLRKIIFTPYATSDFQEALAVLDQPENYSPVDRAWAFFVRQNQGFGGRSGGSTAGNWGRTVESSGGIGKQPSEWRSRQGMFEMWHERIMRAYIENDCAINVIQRWDSKTTTFYFDPPYVSETRRSGKYTVESDSIAFHEKLVDALINIEGDGVISCYDHPVYNPLEKAGWKKESFDAVSHMAGRVNGSGLKGGGSILDKQRRVEVLYVKNSKGQQISLFGELLGGDHG